MSAENATPSLSNFVLTNVRVFDGNMLLDPGTVAVRGGLIAPDAAPDSESIDGHGATLLPGLIDAHVHLHGRETLEQLAGYGITTALDMACWPPSLVQSLRGVPGVTDIRSPGVPAVAPGGSHSHIPSFPGDGLVAGPEQAEAFVEARLAEGADYIKLITDRPGPGSLDQPTLNALVAAAHQRDRLVVAHAANAPAWAMALASGADVITHAPLDRAVATEALIPMLSAGRIAVPTLTMMEGVVQQSGRTGIDYGAARATVAALYKAGVPVLAGTDANTSPGVPARIPHGSSLHHELELLVDAGLSTLDALRAATSLPARYFHLPDRGAIRAGLRADLVLIDGNPLDRISATQRIERIWCAGISVAPNPALLHHASA